MTEAALVAKYETVILLCVISICVLLVLLYSVLYAISKMTFNINERERALEEKWREKCRECESEHKKALNKKSDQERMAENAQNALKSLYNI